MKLFAQQLKWELFRLFARRRTYIGFGIFLLVELVIFLLWTRNRAEDRMESFMERSGGIFEDYYSALTLAFIIVAFTMFFLGVVFVSLIGGDILAKETEDGNLRLLLVRPISRFRLLLVESPTSEIYTTILFLFVGITALWFGVLARGWGGGMFVWAPELPRPGLFEWNEGLQRYFLGIFGFSLVYLPVTGVAFFLSCLRIKPAAATIVTVAIVIADKVLSTIPHPVFDAYRDYFISSRMNSWLLLYYKEIPWGQFWGEVAWLAAIGVTAFLLGWAVFQRRDVKS